jgi:subtilase family serine protease
LAQNANGASAFAPAQIRTAYGINSLAQDGTGQTIAIVEAYDDPLIYQALDTFDSQFGLTQFGPNLYNQYGPASTFLTIVNQNGQATSLPGTDPTGRWESEAALDVEWVHAIAPGAQIIVVESNSEQLADLMAGVVTAASQPGVSVVSMSWGLPEGQAVFQQDEAWYDADLTTPAGHLPVTFVVSTGDYGTADPEYPAFSPNVVAVGGTSLTLNADSSYAGETGWGYYSASAGAFIGSGGGISLYEPQPSYQQGVQSTGNRTTPDVSFDADPATGVWIADPYNLGADNPWEIAGGTSLAAPAWAGLVALADQGRTAVGTPSFSSSSGALAQGALYSLPASDFNTISSGTNGQYTVSTGYNMVTGLGTPVANLLVPAMIAYQGRSPANLTAADVLANGAAPDGSQGATANVINTMNVANIDVGANHGTIRAAAPVVSFPMPVYAEAGPILSLLVPAAQAIQLNPTTQRASQQFDIVGVPLINSRFNPQNPNGLGTGRTFQSMVPETHGAAEYPWPDLLRDVWDLGDMDLDGQAPPTDPLAQTDTAAGALDQQTSRLRVMADQIAARDIIFGAWPDGWDGLADLGD